MPPQGFALHVGLDEWDLNAIPLPDMPPPIGGIEAATAMQQITKQQAFQSSVLLLDSQATLKGVMSAFAQLSGQLADGDLLVITLAGHARLHTDATGSTHQQFLLFNQWWSDADIFRLITGLRASVRVLLVLEACYARGLLLPGIESYGLWKMIQGVMGEHMLGDVATRTSLLDGFLKSPRGWNWIAASVPNSPSQGITADILVLAACSNLLKAPAATHPGKKGSLPPFTRALTESWKASSDYYDLIGRIGSSAAAPQPEILTKLSKPAVIGSKAFPEQRPFTI